MHRPRLAVECQQHMRLDIQQIVRPLAHAQVVELIERGNRPANRVAPGETGTLARCDEFLRGLVDERILEEFDMRRDDLAARLSAALANALESPANFSERPRELAALARNAGTFLRNHDLSAREMDRAADRKSRRGGDAAQHAVE